MSELMTNVIGGVLTALSIPITMLVVNALAAFGRYIDAKTSVWDAQADADKKAALARRVMDAAQQAVVIVQSEFVNRCKEASKDGKLTAAESGAAAKKAIATAGQLLLNEGMELKDEMIPVAIESALNLLKQKLPGLFANPKAEAAKTPAA